MKKDRYISKLSFLNVYSDQYRELTESRSCSRSLHIVKEIEHETVEELILLDTAYMSAFLDKAERGIAYLLMCSLYAVNEEVVFFS